MRFAHAAIAAFLAGGAAGWFWPAKAQQPQQPMSDQQMQAIPQQHMPMDTPTSIGSVQAVCTGVGQGAEDDPRWASFPIRLEFSNKGAQYLSGVHVDLSSASGKRLGALDCDGPWVLLGVPPGTYKVVATLLAQPGSGATNTTFTTPANGQKRVGLQFPLAQNQ